MSFVHRAAIALVLLSLGAMATRATEYVAYDRSGDGVPDLTMPKPPPGGAYPPDWPKDGNHDGLIESGTAAAPRAGAITSLPDLEFELVWDSGTILNTIWTVAAGDANLNDLFDFAGASFAPNVIHLFEAAGGDYVEIWDSSANTPPGAYRDITFADTDDDDLGEILGGEVSTLGKVMLFEESGGGFDFVHDTIRESDFVDGRSVRSVLVSDTDLDGRQEVIVVTGGSSPTSGVVAIWEHSGAIGENTYTRVYEYTTVSYLFQATVGDSDNDSYPEIILGVGGFGGYPIHIRRIEYNPAASTWEHVMYTSSVIGLALTPHVADLDQDDENELAYGSSGFVVIYENAGANTYTPRFMTTEPLGGSVLSLADYPIGMPAVETLAAGSFDGDIGLWGYDAELDTFEQVYALSGIGGAVRGLGLADDEDDAREEMLPAISGAPDQVRVYRRVMDPAALGGGIAMESVLTLSGPNPVQHRARFHAARSVDRLHIHDAQGRVIRSLSIASGTAVWNGRDREGRAVPNGLYLVRAEASGLTGASLRRPRALPLLLVR
jgi:hypothetical protein